MMPRLVTGSVLLLLAIGIVLCNAKVCKISCERSSKNESYGFDANMNVVRTDVGECHTNYLESPDCETPSSGNISGCHRQCGPRSFELRMMNNRTGPFSVLAVKSCYSNRHHCQDCQRKPKYVYLFPGSKYQTKVDEGKCVGQCSNGSHLGCMATRSKNIAIEGPNGDHLVETVEKCSCMDTKCYRVDYFQSYWRQITAEGNNTTAGRTEKLINVGRCVGTCTGIKFPGRCFPAPDDCRLYIQGNQARCAPTIGTTHIFTDDDGKSRSISEIVECGCTTG